MAAMEGVVTTGGQDQQQPPPARVVERLNPAVQQQLNLDSVKTRAISLFKAISRILEDFNAIGATNAVPKWQHILGQFSMVNLELYNIVEDIKNVSKAFVVHPKNVNAENAIILPVMLSSKLLPEMEIEDNTKREQLLHGMQSLPVTAQIDKLKVACESAEKIIADARKGYFGTRQGPTHLPTIDKVQAAKIQEQENLLRSAVNHGEDVLVANDAAQTFSDSSGMYQKGTPPLLSTATNNSQSSLLQMHNQHHVQFSQPLAGQQLQGRQLTSAAMHMSQNQLNQGNQLNRQLNQFSSPANSALFNAAQTTPTSQMIPNMSAMMPSQSILPRMQYGISGGNRSLPSQNLGDQMFNMGGGNASGMMPLQQQQQQTGAAFGNMSQQSGQNLQPGMVTMPNTTQTHPNFQQQRQNQQ
ncbi:mediator of RNA polymerase ii transcription subunit 8 [Phtheirospermum japonicum]|uniref:Mediator of RNA polymerase ii transcription subunit 8 n=1 Tax=Phtheirospermum japonicum TaxID=374723 RepID=A0A830B3H3_9LAMI|nr:mediator of RNA polymerase ii transcription subunit 8 [Phtheirospermum japonicum]